MDTKESDINMLVELGTSISLMQFVRIQMEFEHILNRKVDLAEYKAIKPRLRNKILAEEIRIYG